MVEQVLLLLRVGFVVLLFLFIWRIVRLSVRDLSRPDESLILTSDAGDPRPARPPRARASLGYELVVIDSPSLEIGARIVLERQHIVIGRGEDADARLANDSTASSRHARVVHRDGGLVLEDLGSTNGTFVNGALLDGAHVLRTGDAVTIGGTHLEFRERRA